MVCGAYVEDILGAEFMMPPPWTLSDVFPATSHRTPTIFILSPGADPTAELQRFAEANGRVAGEMSLTHYLLSFGANVPHANLPHHSVKVLTGRELCVTTQDSLCRWCPLDRARALWLTPWLPRPHAQASGSACRIAIWPWPGCPGKELCLSICAGAWVHSSSAFVIAAPNDRHCSCIGAYSLSQYPA